METIGDHWGSVYPEGVPKNVYFVFDLLQFGMLIACSYDKQLTKAAALTAIVGVFMCIYKVAAVKAQAT
jgi:hypothetical protein